MNEEPLHWRVAAALGWSAIEPGNMMNLHDPGVGYPPRYPVIGHKEPVPRFDEDSATSGPLLEQFRLKARPAPGGGWAVSRPRPMEMEAAQEYHARTLPAAVCWALLALSEAGLLMEAK